MNTKYYHFLQPFLDTFYFSFKQKHSLNDFKKHISLYYNACVYES